MVDEDDEEEKPTIIPAAVPSSGSLSDADYKKIVDLYERGESTLVDLALKYGISRQALHKRFRNDGVVRGSKAAVVEAEREVERFIERRSAWIEETRLEGFKALKQVQMIARKIVLDKVKATLPVGEADVDLRAIGRLNKILCDITTSLNILDAHNHVDDKSLPMLVIEDLTDEEVLEHHKATGALDPDATLEDMLREELDGEDD